MQGNFAIMQRTLLRDQKEERRHDGHKYQKTKIQRDFISKEKLLVYKIVDKTVKMSTASHIICNPLRG